MTVVACIFGSRSVEHEVSVITAQQAMAALSAGHEVLPVYIAKDGRWFTGAPLRDLQRFAQVDALLPECTVVTPLIDPRTPGLVLQAVEPARGSVFARRGAERWRADVAMPLCHGGFGEDGTLQGLLEMCGVAFTGSGVAASALAMDKRLTKICLRAAGLPVLDDVVASRERWRTAPQQVLAEVEELSPYPLVVKPLSLGSSIGVSRAENREQLTTAVGVALTYDERCLVEAAQDSAVEINCAVLGEDGDVRASLLEEVPRQGLLSYDDKYRSAAPPAKGGGAGAGLKGARREVPARLDAILTATLRQDACRAFGAVGAAGVARIDMLVDAPKGTHVVNEINPLPGSLSFYLFEPDGLPFPALLDRLLEIAARGRERRRATTAVFDRWMLSGPAAKSGR